MIDLIGYIATALNVVGNLMLTRMRVWGWVIRMLVNVLYIIYAVQIDHGGPVILNHVLFLLVNIEGIRRWRRLEEPFSCRHQWSETGGFDDGRGGTVSRPLAGATCVDCGAVWKGP